MTNGAHVSHETADLIVAASTVHTLADGAAPVAALAIRDGKIAATAGPGRPRRPARRLARPWHRHDR